MRVCAVIPRLLLTCLCAAGLFVPPLAAATAVGSRFSRQKHPQETGFLNRTIELHGIAYRFQVYLPEEWRRDDHKQWPIILFLHGRGERGAEGMWQTQIGLPEAVRDHPERWPFIIVMPQCPQARYWTDPDMMAMAMSALDQETVEFHADTGAHLSHRPFPGRLRRMGTGAHSIPIAGPPSPSPPAASSGATLPTAGTRSPLCPPNTPAPSAALPSGSSTAATIPSFRRAKDEIMFDAFKAAGGHMRSGSTRASSTTAGLAPSMSPNCPAGCSRIASTRMLSSSPSPSASSCLSTRSRSTSPPAQLDSFTGDYLDEQGQIGVTLFRQGDQLFQRNIHGEVTELAAESLSTLFYPNGISLTRILVDRDQQGRITGLTLRDDRHEEHWERRPAPPPH